MSIRRSVSALVLGWLWGCVANTHAEGLESLTPLAAGELPCMCQLDNGDLILAYSRHTPGCWWLYYQMSTDGGRTWLPESRPAAGKYQVEPALLQDSAARLWLLWVTDVLSQNDPDIEYVTSMDRGRTWATHGFLLTPETTTQKPNLVEVGDEIGVLWGWGNWTTTRDAGATWSDITQLVQVWNNLMIYKAQDGRLWVVSWTGSDIWARKSVDGHTWSEPIKITNDGSAVGGAILPEMGQDRYGNFVAVWSSQHHDPNNSDVWYSVSFDNGLSWRTSTRADRWTWRTSESSPDTG